MVEMLDSHQQNYMEFPFGSSFHGTRTISCETLPGKKARGPLAGLSKEQQIGSMYGILTYIYHENQPFM